MRHIYPFLSDKTRTLRVSIELPKSRSRTGDRFPVIVTAYVLLTPTEERRVAAEFGAEYRDYHRRVAMFIRDGAAGDSWFAGAGRRERHS